MRLPLKTLSLREKVHIELANRRVGKAAHLHHQEEEHTLNLLKYFPRTYISISLAESSRSTQGRQHHPLISPGQNKGQHTLHAKDPDLIPVLVSGKVSENYSPGPLHSTADRRGGCGLTKPDFRAKTPKFHTLLMKQYSFLLVCLSHICLNLLSIYVNTILGLHAV